MNDIQNISHLLLVNNWIISHDQLYMSAWDLEEWYMNKGEGHIIIYYFKNYMKIAYHIETGYYRIRRNDDKLG